MPPKPQTSLSASRLDKVPVVRTNLLLNHHATAAARSLLPLQRAPAGYGIDGKKRPAKSLNGDYVERLVWADIEAFLRNPGEVVERLRDRFSMRDEERHRQESELKSLKEHPEQKTAERSDQ